MKVTLLGMLHPTKAIAIAPAISSAYLRESPDPSARTLEPTGHGSYGLPLAIPDRRIIRLPRKDGHPQTRGGLSLLPRKFRRHQLPECSTHFGQSLYDFAGPLWTLQASLPDSTTLVRVLPTRPTPHSDKLSAPLLCTLG